MHVQDFIVDGSMGVTHNQKKVLEICLLFAVHLAHFLAAPMSVPGSLHPLVVSNDLVTEFLSKSSKLNVLTLRLLGQHQLSRQGLKVVNCTRK